MYRRIAALCLLLLLLTGCAQPRKQAYEITWVDVFDTVTTLRGYETNQKTFNETAEKVHDALVYYHRAFDIYNPSPDGNNLYTVNQMAGQEPISLEPDVIQFLADCREAYERTNRRVNVAMGAVLSLWHEARNAGLDDPAHAALPDRAELEAAAEHCAFDTVQIDTEAGTVFLADPLQSLDVGAIAKGWAGQRVKELLPDGYLLNLGGNTCATGAKADGSPWKIAVQSPDAPQDYLCILGLTDACAVTSGDYQRFYTVDGVDYHHIIDPDTLMPARYFRSVTILCPDSGIADCLSTALFLLPLEEGKALAKQFGAEAMWVDSEGQITQTEGFQKAVQ